MDAPTGPLWSQKQAIAYEVALEAINDVIAGYSEQIALEQTHPAPNTARITWGDYTKVTYLHAKGERRANVTRRAGN